MRLEILADFGIRVKELRLRSGISQEVLAHRSGLDRTYISGLERGDRNVSLVNIEKIADALNITISYLFSDERFTPIAAYVKKDFQIPFSERFVYHIDFENKIVSWQINGVLNLQELKSLTNILLGAVSNFKKGEVDVFVDHREMKVNGEPIGYSPEVAEKAIELQMKLLSHFRKAVVLCNSQFMVSQLDQISQTSGVSHRSSHIFGKDRDMIDQAYSLLDIHRNELISSVN